MANGQYQQNSPTQQLPRQGRHAQQYQQNQQYQQYQQYPMRQMYVQNDATTTGGWMLTLLLMCIPIVNFILLLVWAFGSGTEQSKQNWARANLIWLIIGLVVIAVIAAIGMAMGVNYMEYLDRTTVS